MVHEKQAEEAREYRKRKRQRAREDALELQRRQREWARERMLARPPDDYQRRVWERREAKRQASGTDASASTSMHLDCDSSGNEDEHEGSAQDRKHNRSRPTGPGRGPVDALRLAGARGELDYLF